MLAHPPLFILVLHGFLVFGRTELILRLPSLAGGTAALGLAFAWLRRSLGEIAALAGLGFMAIAPVAITAPPVWSPALLRLRISLRDRARIQRALDNLGDRSGTLPDRRLAANYTTIIVLGSPVAAQFVLGLAHLEGYCVENNGLSAYYWLRVADENSGEFRHRSRTLVEKLRAR